MSKYNTVCRDPIQNFSVLNNRPLIYFHFNDTSSLYTMGLEEVFFNYEGVLSLGQMQLSLSVDS